jgi:plasmid stabilization system protein ParE
MMWSAQLQRCERVPRIGVPTQRRFRKMFLHRFPLSIVYVERGEEIVIVAVAHQRRRPGYWRRRQ